MPEFKGLPGECDPRPADTVKNISQIYQAGRSSRIRILLGELGDCLFQIIYGCMPAQIKFGFCGFCECSIQAGKGRVQRRMDRDGFEPASTTSTTLSFCLRTRAVRILWSLVFTTPGKYPGLCWESFRAA